MVDRTRSKRQSDSERRRVKRGLPPQRQPGEGRPRDEDDDYADLRRGGGVTMAVWTRTIGRWRRPGAGVRGDEEER